jgi:hypothetical protein
LPVSTGKQGAQRLFRDWTLPIAGIGLFGTAPKRRLVLFADNRSEEANEHGDND